MHSFSPASFGNFASNNKELSAQKKELRNFYRRERKARYNVETWRHILRSPELTNATRIATYISYEFEPITSDLNNALVEAGKTLYLPRMLENKDLEWVQWDGTPIPINKKNKIQEPVGPAITHAEISEIEVVIVPALHVDRDGNRLGQGGGSYDRALQKMNAWKIALVHYGELNSEPIPSESHDVRMNAAATPDLIVRFHN